MYLWADSVLSVTSAITFPEKKPSECEEDGEGKSIMRQILFKTTGLLYFLKLGLFWVYLSPLSLVCVPGVCLWGQSRREQQEELVCILFTAQASWAPWGRHGVPEPCFSARSRLFDADSNLAPPVGEIGKKNQLTLWWQKCDCGRKTIFKNQLYLKLCGLRYIPISVFHSFIHSLVHRSIRYWELSISRDTTEGKNVHPYGVYRSVGSCSKLLKSISNHCWFFCSWCHCPSQQVSILAGAWATVGPSNGLIICFRILVINNLWDIAKSNLISILCDTCQLWSLSLPDKNLSFPRYHLSQTCFF